MFTSLFKGGFSLILTPENFFLSLLKTKDSKVLRYILMANFYGKMKKNPIGSQQCSQNSGDVFWILEYGWSTVNGLALQNERNFLLIKL